MQFLTGQMQRSSYHQMFITICTDPPDH
jgi:hypothetical protein